MKTPNLDRTLKKFAEAVVEEAQRNIGATRTVDGKKRRTDSTGKLRESLKWTYKNKRLFFGSDDSTSDYAGVVEYGRTPGRKQPPTDAILEWIKKKPIRLRDETGAFTKSTPAKQRALAYLIARKIGKEGTEGILYYNRALNKMFGKWSDRIADAYLEDIDININL